MRLTKRFYGWPEDAQFLVPDEVVAGFRDGIGKRGHDLRTAWDASFKAYAAKYPDLADQLNRMQRRVLPEGWDQDIPTFPADEKGLAGRIASGKVLNAIAQRVPWLIGGAADLAPSTNTRLTFEGAGDFSAANYAGRNFHFGVREHAMGAVLNGMSLSKIRAYGSGFLIFSDYARPAIRLSALMEIPTIHIFTHDSIGVGEDGPTHQPVEQLASLRAIPGLIVLRPADANEVAEAWRVIMRLRHEPGGADPDPAEPADARPQPLRLGRRRRARRLRAGGRRERAGRTCCSWPPAARSRCASPPTSSSRPRASPPA